MTHHIGLFPWYFCLVCLLSGCAPAVSSEATFLPSVSTPLGDGAVRLATASRPYVHVEPVKPEPGGAVVRAPGKVMFRDEAIAQVSAPVPGRLVALHVRVGDKVKAGDSLATLDSPAAASARSELESALVDLHEADDALRRQNQMRDQGVGIESERVAAETRDADARAQLDRARAAAVYLGDGDGPEVVVRAPIDGTILKRRATVGAYLDGSGGPLVEMANPSVLWVVADLFEKDLPLVRAGAEASVELATRTTPTRGRVLSVGTSLDTGLRTAPAYIVLDEGGQALSSGMFARVTIKEDAPDLITLPVSAVLVKEGRRTVIYLQGNDDTTFVEREVVVGPSIDGRVPVISGLRPGDRVVTAGALLLDGAAEQLL